MLGRLFSDLVRRCFRGLGRLFNDLIKFCFCGSEAWTGTHIPYLLCCESYHLGSHFGTILGPFGGGLGRFKTDFLVILGLLKFVKNSPTLPKTGLIGEFLTNFRTPKMTRKTVLNPPKPPPNGPKMVPKCGPRW